MIWPKKKTQLNSYLPIAQKLHKNWLKLLINDSTVQGLFFSISRCTFWLTSTWGGGGKMTEGDKGGEGIILGQVLADVICERPLRHIGRPLLVVLRLH